MSDTLDEILADPCSAYADPMEVLGDPRWSHDEMARILAAMEHDCHLLDIATEENMANGNGNGHAMTLDRVREAQAELERRRKYF